MGVPKLWGAKLPVTPVTMEASFKKNLIQPEYLCSLTKEGL